MNRVFLIIAPPIVFVLAALLAWFTASPPLPSSAAEPSKSQSSRHRQAGTVKAGGASAAIKEFERIFLLDAAPPEEIYDAAGMEEAIGWDQRSAGTPGGGMSGLSFALDWADYAPEEMFSWLVQRGPVDTGWLSLYGRNSFTEILFEVWAEKDMRAALAAVAGISNRQLRRQALLSTLEILGKDDPKRARELMTENLTLFAPADQRVSFNYHRSGATTSKLLLSLPPGKTRNHLLANLLNDMAGWYDDEVADHSLSVWRGAPDALRRDLVDAGFISHAERYASFDGLDELLRERAERSGESEAAQKYIKIQGPAWAIRDLPGALEWAQEYLKGANRVDRSAELFKYAAGEDFDTALRVWEALPDSVLKAHAAGALSKGAPAERRLEAQALVESLPSHRQKQAWQFR